MKKIVLFLLCFTLIIGATGMVTFAEDDYGISLCNNNVMITDSSFYINDSNGYTEILTAYYGYVGITTGGKVTTTLEKKNGSSWDEVEKWVAEATGTYYDNVYCLYLTEHGEYKVTIEYRVSGTAGPDDVITETLLNTY